MMNKRTIRSGMTLAELLTVIATMALLMGIAVPAARAIIDSFEGSAGVTNVISAALSNARAIAMYKEKDVGVRFQQDLRGNQYMIFIEYDKDIRPVNGFVAVQGRKPMRLPSSIGVMDLYLVDRSINPFQEAETPNWNIDRDYMIDEQHDINDTTTFSIIFDRSGKLITSQVWVRNRDNETSNDTSTDDVFNTVNQVDAGVGQFIDDGYDALWDPSAGGDDDWAFGPENSRRRFIIYNKSDFNKINSSRRWSGYLRHREVLYVNPYSGQLQ